MLLMLHCAPVQWGWWPEGQPLPLRHPADPHTASGGEYQPSDEDGGDAPAGHKI